MRCPKYVVRKRGRQRQSGALSKNRYMLTAKKVSCSSVEHVILQSGIPITVRSMMPHAIRYSNALALLELGRWERRPDISKLLIYRLHYTFFISVSKHIFSKKHFFWGGGAVLIASNQSAQQYTRVTEDEKPATQQTCIAGKGRTCPFVRKEGEGGGIDRYRFVLRWRSGSQARKLRILHFHTAMGPHSISALKRWVLKFRQPLTRSPPALPPHHPACRGKAGRREPVSMLRSHSRGTPSPAIQ